MFIVLPMIVILCNGMIVLDETYSRNEDISGRRYLIGFSVFLPGLNL